MRTSKFISYVGAYYMKSLHRKGIILLIMMLVIGSNFISIERGEPFTNLKTINSVSETSYEEHGCGGFPLPDTVVPDEPPSETFGFPSSWDWRDAEYNGRNGDWTTPIKNQGDCGSCWAFAAIGALEAMANVRKGYPDIDLDLSEQHLVSCCRSGCNGCRGGSTTYAWDYLKDNGGAILESCFPYEGVDANGCGDWESDECDEDPVPCNSKCEEWMDFVVPISSFGYYNEPAPSLIKSTIVNHGPVVTYMLVYGDLRYHRGGIYEHDPDAELRGGHVVVIIGYNDSENYLICKNSWGTNWGEDGYFRISYGECMLGEQIYYVDINPNSLNFPPIADAGDLYHGDVGETIVFDSGKTSDLDDNIVSYEWDFGDGTTSTEPNSSHSYNQKGIYDLKLTVTDEQGKQDVDESAVFIDMWDVDDFWVYNVSFNTNPNALYPPIYLPGSGSIGELNVTVTDEFEDTYKLDFKGSVEGSISVNFDIKNIPFDFILKGKLKRTTLQGTIYVTKAGLGVKEINYHLHGTASLIVIPCVPFPLWLPAPFDISVIKTFETPRTMLGISPDIGRKWNISSTNSSQEITFSTLFGLISKSLGNENIFEKDVAFECCEIKDIVTQCGTYESYGISIQSSHEHEMLEYYYSPEVYNVVRIQGGDAELFNFSGELISTNIK